MNGYVIIDFLFTDASWIANTTVFTPLTTVKDQRISLSIGGKPLNLKCVGTSVTSDEKSHFIAH